MLLFIFSTNLLVAQKKKSFSPIFIVNQEIVSKEKIEEYMKSGAIKSMKNSITDEEYVLLKKKLGDKIDGKEFIALIEVYSKAEMRKKKRELKEHEITKRKFGKEFILSRNDRAADFTVDMINGEKIRLSDLKGKVVLLNFWATWCAPCIREFHEMPSKILDVYENEDFVLLPFGLNLLTETLLKKSFSYSLVY